VSLHDLPGTRPTPGAVAAALGYRPARCLGAAWSQPNARHLRRRTHANFTRKARRERQPCQSNGACIRIGKEYSDGGAERVLARRRRMAVSVSVQFEAGGQPVSGAGGPITEPILPGFADLGQNSFYEYGARESVPRILDLSGRSA